MALTLVHPRTAAQSQRAFWVLALALDLLLLILLPKILAVWIGIVTLLITLHFARRVEWLLAFVLLGMPLLDPIRLPEGLADGLLIGLRLLFVIAWLLALRRAGGERGVSAALSVGRVLRDPRTQLVLFLAVWIWVGLLWTDAPEYGGGKARSYTLTGTFLFLAAYLLWPFWAQRWGIDRFLVAALIVGGLVAVVGLAVSLGVAPEALQGNVGHQQGAPTERLAWLGTNAIWLARIMAVWLLLLLWAAERRVLHPVVAGLLVVGALFLILRTGSRGPLVALLASPLALVLLPRRAPGHRSQRGLSVALVTACLVITLVVLMMPVEEKARVTAAVLRSPIGMLLGAEGVGAGASQAVGERLLQDPSTVYRTELARRCIETLADALPWGSGTGGFSTAIFLRDFRIYPHNLEAELLFENGLPGLMLLLLFLLLTWRAARRSAARDNRVRWFWVLFAMAWLNAQVSGDITLNEGVWFWGGMIAAAGAARDSADPGLDQCGAAPTY